MALDGTENSRAILDEGPVRRFPAMDWVAEKVMAGVLRYQALSIQPREKLAVFMTADLYRALAAEHQILTYAGNMPDTFLGLPIRIVLRQPGSLACWVGELVFEEELEENDGHKASDVRGQQTT